MELTMTDETPIKLLVQRVRSFLKETSALFGFVFEMRSDGENFARGCPLTGTITAETTLREWYRTCGEYALGARSVQRDQIVPMPNSSLQSTSPRKWVALVITQHLNDLACIVILYEFASEHEAQKTYIQLVADLSNLNFRTQGAAEPNSLRLDRLFETCTNNDCDALIISGYTPILRFDSGLRRASIAPPAGELILHEVTKVAPEAERCFSVPGLRIFELNYGRHSKFEIATLGSPGSVATVCTRSRDGSFLTPINCTTSGANSLMESITPMHSADSFDVILAQNAPAIAWRRNGAHPLTRDILSSADIEALLNQAGESSAHRHIEPGHTEFTAKFGSKLFRVHSFCKPTILLLISESNPEIQMDDS